MNTTDYWAILLDTTANAKAWWEAFEELFDDARLPALLADELERDHPPARRDVTLAAAEQAQFYDPALRTRVTASLLKHARGLRDEGGGPALWCAIRRYASMVPVEHSDTLLEFMRADDDVATIQCALQGIHNIYEVEASPDCPARDRLRERVHALAVERIDPAVSQTSTDVAMCFCCCKAAHALRDPEYADVLARLDALGHRRLSERAREFQ